MRWALPGDYRVDDIDATTRLFRVNVASTPSLLDIREALRALLDRTARAAAEQELGLPPEIEMFVIYDSDAETGMLLARVTGYDLVDDIDALTAPLPDAMTAIDGSLHDVIEDCMPDNADAASGDRDSDALADALMGSKTGTAPILLTFQEPPIDGLHEQTPTPCRYEPYSTKDEVKQRVTPETDTPDTQPLTYLLAAIDDLDSDIICQLHVGLGYEVDDTHVYTSRSTELWYTTLDPADIDAASHVAFSFRLFGFNHNESDSQARKRFRQLGEALQPWFHGATTPALYQRTSLREPMEQRDYVRSQLVALLRGAGHPHTDTTLGGYLYLPSCLDGWLSPPPLTDALDVGFGPAARYSPVASADATTRDALLTATEYPLGQDPTVELDLSVSTRPQRHAIFAEATDRRHALLSKRIQDANRARDHPVFVLDMTGDLIDTHVRRLAHNEQAATLSDHAVVDVADTYLPCTPLHTSETAGASTPLAATDAQPGPRRISTRIALYKRLLETYVRSDEYTKPVQPLEDVLEAVSRNTEVATLPHSALVDEVTKHLPQTTVSDAPRAVTVAQRQHDFLTTVEDAVPAWLLGEYHHDTTIWDVAPTDGVLWLDLSGISTTLGRRLAATIILDAIDRTSPTREPTADPAGTVAISNAEQIPIPDNFETAVTTSSAATDALVDTQPPLACIAGFDVAPDADILYDHAALCDPDDGAALTVSTQTSDANLITLPKTVHRHDDRRARQRGTANALVAIPDHALDATRGTELFVPVTPPGATDIPQQGGVDQGTAKLYDRGEHRAPAQPAQQQSPDLTHAAIHATRLPTRSSTSSSQLALTTFNSGGPHFACSKCHARYEDRTDALACHAPDRPHNTNFSAARLQSDSTPRISLPAAVRDCLTCDHDDALTHFLCECLAGRAADTDLDAIRTRIRDGLKARLDGATHGDIPLDALVFLQAIEVARLDLAPALAGGSMRELRRRCLADSDCTIDNLTPYVNIKTDSRDQRYYALSDFGQNLAPITTLTTPTDTPYTPVLDDSYPVNTTRRALAREFATHTDATSIEFFHHPNQNELTDTVPRAAFDVAALDDDGKLTDLGILVPDTATTNPLHDALDWARHTTAEVHLCFESTDAAQRAVNDLATTDILNLNRGTQTDTTPETAHETAAIASRVEWPTWQRDPPTMQIISELVS